MEGAALRFMLMALAGWWSDQRQAAVAYLIEENRVLRAQLHGRRVRLTDEDRCPLARAGHRLGRRLLRQVATIARHDSRLASAANRPHVDVREGAAPSVWRPCRDPATGD